MMYLFIGAMNMADGAESLVVSFLMPVLGN
jgi:hypothetical protein